MAVGKPGVIGPYHVSSLNKERCTLSDKNVIALREENGQCIAMVPSSRRDIARIFATSPKLLQACKTLLFRFGKDFMVTNAETACIRKEIDWCEEVVMEAEMP